MSAVDMESLFLAGGVPSYADLGSTNGSALHRGKKSKKIKAGRRGAVKLSSGDRVVIGDVDEQLSLIIESVDAEDEAVDATPTLVVSQRSAALADELLAQCRSPDALAVLCRFASCCESRGARRGVGIAAGKGLPQICLV